MRKSSKIVAVYRELRCVKGMRVTAGELFACATALVELFSAVYEDLANLASKTWVPRQWVDMLPIEEAWGRDCWYVFCRDHCEEQQGSDRKIYRRAAEVAMWANGRREMQVTRYGLALAAKEHIASGQPLTRLEAMVLYGVANLPDLIKEMRGQGFVIKSRLVTYAAAAERINRHAVLQPPSNLPIREVHVTEYWLSK